jgi:hypothetical protein
MNVESYNSLVVKSSSRTSISRLDSINNDDNQHLNDTAIDEIRSNNIEERPLVENENDFCM